MNSEDADVWNSVLPAFCPTSKHSLMLTCSFAASGQALTSLCESLVKQQQLSDNDLDSEQIYDCHSMEYLSELWVFPSPEHPGKQHRQTSHRVLAAVIFRHPLWCFFKERRGKAAWQCLQMSFPDCGVVMAPVD